MLANARTLLLASAAALSVPICTAAAQQPQQVAVPGIDPTNPAAINGTPPAIPGPPLPGTSQGAYPAGRPIVTPPPGNLNGPGDGTEAPSNPASGSAFPLTPPPVINPINQAPVPLTDKETAGAAITRHWRAARSMPATGDGGAVVFSYGATEPSIVCAPLTVCLLKLEPGERVLRNGLQAGDTARWKITPTLTGNDQTVLVIKPTDAGLRTTLAVMTDKRVYTINLVSVASESRSMALSEFSYPDETRAEWAAYYAQQEQQRQDDTMPNGRNIAALDFNYRIGGDDPSWRPLRAYNDGVHTYIQFPDSMRSADAPSLLTLAHDGTWFSAPTGQLVNYRKEGNTYVVDLVIDRAELVLGVGGGQQRVTIKHTGD